MRVGGSAPVGSRGKAPGQGVKVVGHEAEETFVFNSLAFIAFYSVREKMITSLRIVYFNVAHVIFLWLTIIDF